MKTMKNRKMKTIKN